VDDRAGFGADGAEQAQNAAAVLRGPNTVRHNAPGHGSRLSRRTPAVAEGCIQVETFTGLRMKQQILCTDGQAPSAMLPGPIAPICISGDRILVHESLAEDFTQLRGITLTEWLLIWSDL
jgi:hypothetical protein